MLQSADICILVESLNSKMAAKMAAKNRICISIIQCNTIVVYWKYQSWQKPQLRLQDYSLQWYESVNVSSSQAEHRSQVSYTDEWGVDFDNFKARE